MLPVDVNLNQLAKAPNNHNGQHAENSSKRQDHGASLELINRGGSIPKPAGDGDHHAWNLPHELIQRPEVLAGLQVLELKRLELPLPLFQVIGKAVLHDLYRFWRCGFHGGQIALGIRSVCKLERTGHPLLFAIRNFQTLGDRWPLPHDSLAPHDDLVRMLCWDSKVASDRSGQLKIEGVVS